MLKQVIIIVFQSTKMKRTNSNKFFCGCVRSVINESKPVGISGVAREECGVLTARGLGAA